MTSPVPTLPRPATPRETLLLEIRPHPAFVVLRSQALLAAIVAIGALAWWLGGQFGAGTVVSAVPRAAAGLLAITVIWNALVWWSRGYQLTSRRLIRTAGVLNRSTIEVPLARIQHMNLYRSWIERLLGLGSLGFSTAGSAWMEMVWVNIDRPAERLAQIRAAAEAQASAASNPTQPGLPPHIAGQIRPAAAANAPGEGGRIPIIGLAGGIGSGKSEVARILEELGCFVIDSDRQAREALDRPEVRDQLVQWWGRSILKDDGKVDRSEVARIVFGHADQRHRLERLVHPLVRARRDDLIERARAAGARAAIVDAPLLFEAGVDQECDTVIFVDAPRDLRLQRVKEGRGWTEAELDRRERAQLPLEEKQRRSHFTVVNAGDRTQLGEAVASILSMIESKHG